jgi:hypothetical protein
MRGLLKTFSVNGARSDRDHRRYRSTDPVRFRRLAIDGAMGRQVQARLQTAGDAAALAAVQRLPDTAAANRCGLSTSRPRDVPPDYGTVLTSSDIVLAPMTRMSRSSPHDDRRQRRSDQNRPPWPRTATASRRPLLGCGTDLAGRQHCLDCLPQPGPLNCVLCSEDRTLPGRVGKREAGGAELRRSGELPATRTQQERGAAAA